MNNDSIVTLTNLVTNQQYIINLCNGSYHFGNISENIYRVQISGIKFFKKIRQFFSSKLTIFSQIAPSHSAFTTIKLIQGLEII